MGSETFTNRHHALREIVSHGQENTKHGDWWQSDREKGLKGIE